MKKLLTITSLFISTLVIVGFTQIAIAQTESSDITTNPNIGEIILEDVHIPEATDEAAASSSGKLASPSAEVEQKIQEKKDKDITETGGKQKSKLATYLDENPPGPLSWHNPLQHAIRLSIEKGLAANIIVLMLLFPLIATIVAASRHIVGLKGFGIYIPAVLSVAFVSTGILTGVLLFVVILLSATISRKVTKKLKMPYLPRTAMLLLGVSFLTLLLLITSTIFEVFDVLSINIFPLLIIMLLTENFMESQLFTSQREALKVTAETLFIAVLCSLLISFEYTQKVIILKPELTLILAALTNFIIAKYTGLRLIEHLRFKTILKK